MVSLVTEEASGSEDISSDQKIVKLQQQINRQFAIDDFKGAVPACEELCALISSKYDELHDECADPYYQYATALLELAREENQVLGGDKLQGQEEGPDSTEQGESSANGTPDTAADTTEADTPATDTSNNEEEEGDAGEGGDADDDISSLQIAWEVLELSRIIYARQETPGAEKKLAKVKIKLGEVCMENEKMDEAITQFTESIEHFVAGGEQPDSREISSTYYMMGLAASLDQKYDQAVHFFSKCSELMAFQIAKEEESERASLLEMKGEVDKMVADCKDSLRQLEQYRKLIPSQVTAAGCDSSSSGANNGASSSGVTIPSSSSSANTNNNATNNNATNNNATNNNVTTSNVTPVVSVTPSITMPVPAAAAPAFSSAFGSATSSSGFGSSSSGFGSSSSSGPVSNISHLVRKRPVSQPVQPVSQTSPSSSSEISAKLSVKPTVRVSPMVSSSTSPPSGAQPNRHNDRQTNRADNQAAAAPSTSPTITSTLPTSSNLTSSNPTRRTPSLGNATSSNAANSSSTSRSASSMVQSSSEAQPLPSQAVVPRASVNRHTNGVSSTSGLDARLSGSSTGFTETTRSPEAATTSEAEGRVSDNRAASHSSRQVATVSSVQRAEEAISSSSDFKRPAEEVEDMSSNEAKRSRQ